MSRSSPERYVFEPQEVSTSTVQGPRYINWLGNLKYLAPPEGRVHRQRVARVESGKKGWDLGTSLERWGFILKAAGSTWDVCKHYVQLSDCWKGRLPWAPLSEHSSNSTGVIHTAGSVGNVEHPFYWGLSLSFCEPTGVTNEKQRK